LIIFCITLNFFKFYKTITATFQLSFNKHQKKQRTIMSSSAEQLANDYARGEIDGVPKCGQGMGTKSEQVLFYF
jgi:hypothetical protein